MKFISRN